MAKQPEHNPAAKAALARAATAKTRNAVNRHSAGHAEFATPEDKRIFDDAMRDYWKAIEDE